MSNMIIANTSQIEQKSATPKSIQNAPPYISRAPYYFQNPTYFTYDQWRMVAREPVCRLCIRHILREINALEWEITSDKPKQDRPLIDWYTGVLDEADDGEGWDDFISRTLQDALELPIGGFGEQAEDDVTGLLGGIYSVDAATVYPTYDETVPFVQINPFNTIDRVWFSRGEFFRLKFMPRPDVQRRPFQESPVESALMGIEALSRMYIYYMKQLSDTPMSGILDVMDMSADEAADWATGFRELFSGVDPFKIPLLYAHTKPARWIPFGRTPQDLNIIEEFKRFAEMVASAFGLSIGDLRLFEHERTLAGVEASQRVSARQGSGYYAQAIEDMVNRNFLKSTKSGLKFRFKMGMTGELQAEAQLALTRTQILLQATGNQAFLKQNDAQKQAENWKIVDVELTGLPQAPGLPGLEMFDTASGMDSIDQDAEKIQSLSDGQGSPLATIDQAHGEMPQLKSSIRRRRKDTAIKVAKSLRAETKRDFLVVPIDGWHYVVEK